MMVGIEIEKLNLNYKISIGMEYSNSVFNFF